MTHSLLPCVSAYSSSYLQKGSSDMTLAIRVAPWFLLGLCALAHTLGIPDQPLHQLLAVTVNLSAHS